MKSKLLETFIIGTGAWRELAEFAADQIAHHNGVNVTVLGDRDLASFKLVHSSWAKLRLFELTSADEIIVADADLCALEDGLNELAFMARRHKVDLLGCSEPLNPAVDAECQLYDIPRERYFNCGLLYLHRRALPALEWAWNRHPHYGSWLEQTALNCAVRATGTPYAVAPARFNHLIPVREISTEEIHSTGAANVHFAGWKDPATILAAMQELTKAPTT